MDDCDTVPSSKFDIRLHLPPLSIFEALQFGSEKHLIVHINSSPGIAKSTNLVTVVG